VWIDVGRILSTRNIEIANTAAVEISISIADRNLEIPRTAARESLPIVSAGVAGLG